MNCISSQNFSTTNNIRHVSHITKKASIQKNSKERYILLLSQSDQKKSKKDHERKKANDENFISLSLDNIFNQCRKVPQSVKRILIDKGNHYLDYTCIYPGK